MAKEDALINIGVNGQAVSDALAKIGKDVDTMANSLTGRLARIGGAAAALGPLFSAVGGVMQSAFDGVRDSVMKAADREQVKLRFDVMLGDSALAEEFVGKLTDLAAKTPLEMDEIFAAGSALVARTSLRGDEAVDYIKRLGDASVAAGIPLQQMVELFAKVHQRGGLSNEVVESLANANIPVMEVLQAFEKEGTTRDEIFRNLSEKKYGVDVFMAVIDQVTGEGGQVFGMMERQAATFKGVLSTLEDTVGELMVKFGEQLLPVLTDVGSMLTEALEGAAPLMEQIGVALADIVKTQVAPMMKDLLANMGDKLPGIVVWFAEAQDGVAAFASGAVKALGVVSDVAGWLWKYLRRAGAVIADAVMLVLGDTSFSHVQAVDAAEQEEKRAARESAARREALQKKLEELKQKREAERAAGRAEAKAIQDANRERWAAVKEEYDARGREAVERSAAAQADLKRREEAAKRLANWQKSESERRRTARMDELKELPYEQRRKEVEERVRARGVEGEVTSDSITARINELMKEDAVGHEHEIAELKDMRKLWDELAKLRADYNKSAEESRSELWARYYELSGNDYMAAEVREQAEIDRRTAELEKQGATAEEAYELASLEARMARAEKEVQEAKEAARGLEFVQQEGAHVGSGATSIRLGDIQLDEQRKGNKLLDEGNKVLTDVLRYLKDNMGTSQQRFAVLS